MAGAVGFASVGFRHLAKNRMALALGHPVGHPVDTGSQDMPCQEASGIRFVASHGELNPEGLNGIKE